MSERETPHFFITDFTAAFMCICGTTFNVQCKYPSYKFACPNCNTCFTIDLSRKNDRILFGVLTPGELLREMKKIKSLNCICDVITRMKMPYYKIHPILQALEKEQKIKLHYGNPERCVGITINED